MEPLELFLFLQVLDVLTTLLGFRLGASEASPFIRILMQFGPATGVILSKGIAVVLGGICLGIRRPRLIVAMNYWFALVVLWNVLMLFRALSYHP